MSETEEFDRVSTDIRQILNNQPSHPNALELYGLYKQATCGDVNIARPSLFDFRGKAKWDSWYARKGLSQDEAKLQYIRLGKNVLNEIMSQSLDLFSMAHTVKNVLPQVPIDVIRRDLIITNNVDETIARLLDGTVYYDMETEVLPPASVNEVKDVKLDEKKDTPKASNDVSSHNKESSNAVNNEPLKTISPMSFNTKAATFEKDPHERMKSYQERKQKLLEVAREHYIEKHGLDKN